MAPERLERVCDQRDAALASLAAAQARLSAATSTLAEPKCRVKRIANSLLEGG